jgi:hypothetical protein
MTGKTNKTDSTGFRSMLSFLVYCITFGKAVYTPWMGFESVSPCLSTGTRMLLHTFSIYIVSQKQPSQDEGESRN